jgi:hypothetical protein
LNCWLQTFWILESIVLVASLATIFYVFRVCNQWWQLRASDVLAKPSIRLAATGNVPISDGPVNAAPSLEVSYSRPDLYVLPQALVMCFFELFNACLYLWNESSPNPSLFVSLKWIIEISHCFLLPVYLYSLTQLLRFYHGHIPTPGERCPGCRDAILPTLPRASTIGFCLCLAVTLLSVIASATSTSSYEFLADLQVHDAKFTNKSTLLGTLGLNVGIIFPALWLVVSGVFAGIFYERRALAIASVIGTQILGRRHLSSVISLCIHLQALSLVRFFRLHLFAEFLDTVLLSTVFIGNILPQNLAIITISAYTELGFFATLAHDVSSLMTKLSENQDGGNESDAAYRQI